MATRQDSFFGCLKTEQILIFIAQAHQELRNRECLDEESHWGTDQKRAARFGIPVFDSSSDQVLSRSLLASRKDKPDNKFDDTHVIRRNKKQRQEFVAFLDRELDEYAQERDRIIAEKEAEWYSQRS